jgi:S-adenosylmethionine uptake transporter
MITVQLLGGATLRSGDAPITGPPAQRHRIALLTLVVAALIPWVGIEFPQAVHWPWLLFAASLAIASHMLLSWAYARAEANYLAATEFTSFLWAALFGWLIFHEALSPYTLAGAALIVAGCLLAASKPGEATPRLEAAT